MPRNEVLRNYVFGHNETHMALALDYGSVLNHHESANVQAEHFSEVPPGNDVVFRVCMVLCVGIAMFKKMQYACMHTHKRYTDT